MKRRTRLFLPIALSCLFAGSILVSPSAAQERRDERPRSRGLFGLDLDIRDGGVDVQVGPIRLAIGDEERDDRASMAWLFRRGEIIGTPVRDEAGKELGRVDELVIDVRIGHIRYAAIEYPRLFGKNKLYAVPWSEVTLYRSEDGVFFRIDVPAAKLKEAPGFDRGKWPNVGNRRWAEAIDVYYGVVVKPGDLKTDFGSDVKPLVKVPHLMRSSDAVGIPVVNLKGKRLGRLDDLIVDFSSRKVRYGVLRLDGIGIENKRFPVIFSSLDFQPPEIDRKPALTLRIEHALLGKVPFFDAAERPDIRDPRWSRSIDRYYGVDRPIPAPRGKRE